MFIKRFFTATLSILSLLIACGCPTGITHIPKPLEPPVYEPFDYDSETVSENEDGWKVSKDTTREAGSDVGVYRYVMYDPITKTWYPAVSAGNNTVIMTEHGKELWRKDRMALPENERFKALPEKPEVETDEEIDYGGSCFGPNTKVLMANGDIREISSIRDGEIVKSYNIEKDFVEDKKVTKTYVFPTKGYYLINGELKATARHKFLIAGNDNTWKKASELRPGDRVQSINGEITITTIEKIEEKGSAHNFEVADTKAYIVRGGEHYYVVHNGL